MPQGKLRDRFQQFVGKAKKTEANPEAEERFLNSLADDLVNNPDTRKQVELILSYDENSPAFEGVLAHEERALPGNQKFRENGWWRYMLMRYALARYFGADKMVLDSCSGLGWGTYLVDSSAATVVAVDLDRPALDSARVTWPTTRTHHLQGSVLELPVRSASIDLALAMESIEHFERADIDRYLDELWRVLKPGGMLLGSSAFPETREKAIELQLTNPYHLHICTRAELVELLEARFSSFHIYSNHLFFRATK